MPSTTLLFNSIDAAREIAYMLRAEWDGCNAVTLAPFDANDSAFKVALKVNKAIFCHVKASQPLNPLLRFLYQKGIFLGLVFFLASLISSQLSSITFRAFILSKVYTFFTVSNCTFHPQVIVEAQK